MIDPYLSDSLTKKYAGTNKPHVRMTERVIAPERLDFIEVVTSSHNHTDHLDGETLIPLLKANPGLTVIVPRANMDFAAERMQVSPKRLTAIRTDSESININPFTFHAIPSAHESLEQDENGDHRFIGLILQVGKWTIYHSGDCVPYDGLVERLHTLEDRSRPAPHQRMRSCAWRGRQLQRRGSRYTCKRNWRRNDRSLSL